MQEELPSLTQTALRNMHTEMSRAKPQYRYSQQEQIAALPYDKAYKYALAQQKPFGPLQCANGLLASYLTLPHAHRQLEALLPIKVDPVTFRGQTPVLPGKHDAKKV